MQQGRCSIVVSIPACHAGDPGSIPGNGDFFYFGNRFTYSPSTWVIKATFFFPSRRLLNVIKACRIDYNRGESLFEKRNRDGSLTGKEHL